MRNVVVTNPGLDPWGEAFYKCVAWSDTDDALLSSLYQPCDSMP